jgi:hypothetical protein
MRRTASFYFWIWVLIIFMPVPPVNAETGEFHEAGEFTFFEWGVLRGFNTQAEGWDVHLGGQLAVDALYYDSDNAKDSGFRWETVNVLFAGNYENRLFLHVEPDLLGIDTRNNLYEAWAGWHFDSALRVKAGQVKVALNTEFATREENRAALDYSFSSYLDGRYDLGLQIDGSLWSNLFWYETTAVAGNGFDLDGNSRDAAQFSIRAVAFPLNRLRFEWLKGAFAGLSFAYSPDFDDELFLATPLRSTTFATKDLDGDSARWLRGEVGWFWGPLRMGAERVHGAVNDVKVSSGGRKDFDQLTSWSAYGAWYITGQRARWKQGRWLGPLLEPAAGQNNAEFDFMRFFDSLGCLEIAFRYSNADIDRDLFKEGLTDYGISSQEVRTATLNLNWYPRDGLVINAGWVKTIADQDLSTFGGTDRDSSFILRTILTF